MSLKSIFDGLYVDQLFHKNERGETVFYPHGMIGRGYVLPAEAETGMRAKVRLRMLVSIVIGFTFATFVLRMINEGQSASSTGWTILAATAVPVFAGIAYFQSRLSAGLEPVAGPRPSAGEWFRRGRRARATWTYWASAVTGALMLVTAAFVVALALAEGDLVTTISAVIILAIGALLTWDGTLGVMERWLGE